MENCLESQLPFTIYSFVLTQTLIGCSEDTHNTKKGQYCIHSTKVVRYVITLLLGKHAHFRTHSRSFAPNFENICLLKISQEIPFLVEECQVPDNFRVNFHDRCCNSSSSQKSTKERKCLLTFKPKNFFPSRPHSLTEKGKLSNLY